MIARAAQTGAVQGDKGVASEKNRQSRPFQKPAHEPDEDHNEDVQSGTSNENRSRQRSSAPVSTSGATGSAGGQGSVVRNSYEIAVLYHPDLEIDLEKATSRVEKIINDNGGKISKTDNWGRRKLAYPINKLDYAVYVFYIAEVPPKNVAKIEQTFNITDEMIRFLITKPDFKAMAKAEAQKAEKVAKAAAHPDTTENDDVAVKKPAVRKKHQGSSDKDIKEEDDSNENTE